MPRAELELLAPARDADIGIDAVNHCADAVYIGGPAFGARDKAGNSLAEIGRLVRHPHPHRHGARIFVTYNTILRDNELPGARQLAWDLWNIGVDALIVQDMGFSQIVLARELTLPQIRAIEAQVQGAVLEFFVHDALCVAYSGQCFISHTHTGHIANRGSCSQECRLAYTVTDAQGRIVAHHKHVLSLKENDQSANLHALVDAGIRCFKIEGRYKDVATANNVTAHYRQLRDRVLEERACGPTGLKASSSGRCRYTFTPDPERAYNRAAPTTSSTAARSISAPSTRPSTPASPSARSPRLRLSTRTSSSRRLICA
jgi:collagenase-like PrtC family protease